eukprot:TRINITY_DN5258_c0_g1_i1.p1 TRINITY_DN5258_c0_g1~~TRINITY_DN5258_c0_g1_i1.p1  ORF type:complete len:767 (+),score=168.60 TRINITY_DN5258_c0_g1_i1:40-2301(+)
MKSTLLLLAASSATAAALPNGYAWGCLNITKDMPFCNPKLPIDERVKDLVTRMTTDEKIGIMSGDPKTNVNTCNNMDSGVSRLGIPEYMNLVEFNTGVAAQCYAPEKCSTTYIGPTGTGASFNKTSWNLKGKVLSDQFRAYNNLNWMRGTGDKGTPYIGLSGYGPNINIVRDPRWGRNSEVPSEDPFHAGTYAKYYLRGGQDGEDKRYTKVAMGLKHYTAYSVENGRGSFIPNITMHDLWETFLSQYKLGFLPEEGNASAVMCSYAGVNGVHSCMNEYLLTDVMRTQFQNPHAVTVTDCGAVNNAISDHHAKDKVDAASKFLTAGNDVEMGDTDFMLRKNGGGGGYEDLLSKNDSYIKLIDESVSRIMRLRFKTGMFDPVDDQPYTKIGAEVLNNTESQTANYEAALQSFVLLKNDKKVLPFAPTSHIAVVGPHVNSTRDLMSDYIPDIVCYGDKRSEGWECIPRIQNVFPRYHTQGKVTVARGVDLDSDVTSGIPAAVEAAKSADVTLAFVGIGHTQEHEGHDRTNVTLPGVQEDFVKQLIATGKPVVVVLINGGAVSLGSEIISGAAAIVEAFYPSTETKALYDTLVGTHNKWGKMPITVMPSSDVYSLEMTSFDMAKAPGRTYKYYTGVPEWAYGFGLSYTTFSIFGCSADGVSVRNSGDRTGDEVVLVYHGLSDALRQEVEKIHPVPKMELVGFERITLAPGAVEKVTFKFPPSTWDIIDENGKEHLYPGLHFLEFSNGVQTCRYNFEA